MKNYMWLFLLVGLFVGCEDDDNLTASGAEENRLNQYLDLSRPLIKESYEAYGTYILYDFDQLLDFAYQFNQAQTWRNAQITKLEQKDVDGALKFLEEYFLPYYKEEIELEGTKIKTYFREKYLPRKILLVGKLYADIASNNWKYFNAVANINSLTLSKMTGEQIEEMKRLEGELDKYVRDVHYTFLVSYLYQAKRVELASESFYDLSKEYYGQKAPTVEEGEAINPKVYWNLGFFEPRQIETNYPSRGGDLVRYISEMLNLDASLADEIRWERPVIRSKMKYIVGYLQEMGVDILAMNSNIAEAVF